MSEQFLQAVGQGGVAIAEFSTDVTFSQWFCFLINACSSLQSLLCLFERYIANSPKYRGIWAICMHKMMFPSESSNSVSKGSFREFRPFSVIAENHWPYICTHLHTLSPSFTDTDNTFLLCLSHTHTNVYT